MAASLPARFDRRRSVSARAALDTLNFQERFIFDTLTERRARLSVSCRERIGSDHVLVEYVESVSPKGRSVRTAYERSTALASAVKTLRARGWLRFVPSGLDAETDPNPFGHVVLTDAADFVLEAATGRSRY